MSTLASGIRLHDRFTLIERIGAGGMSEVWRAEDGVLDRQVAIKVLSAPLAADPGWRATTWREARAAARLSHPNVTQVYDYGEATLPGGAAVPYLVMELIAGHTLSARIARGPVPWREAASVGAQVAAALAAAHRLGIVHRDVKPGNVMLTAGGVKVLDFGIAAFAGRPELDGELVLGTPRYMAPERLSRTTADPAGDVYSLGVLLHEALTGRPPSPAADAAEAPASHRDSALPPPIVPELPPAFADLLLACVRFDPASRPTAEQVAAALTALNAAPAATPTTRIDPVPAGGQSPPTLVGGAIDAPPRSRGGRHRTALVALAAAVVAVGVTLSLAGALRPDRSANLGPVITPGATATTAPPARSGPPLNPAAQTSPSPPSAGTSTPTDPPAVIAALGDAITQAVETGRIDARTARMLRERVDKLRGPVDRGKNARDIAKQALQLSNEIDKQRADGRLDRQTANQLTALLQPLIGDFGHGDDEPGHGEDDD